MAVGHRLDHLVRPGEVWLKLQCRRKSSNFADLSYLRDTCLLRKWVMSFAGHQPMEYETCPRCEDGWEPHGGKCYFFSWVILTWDQSRTQCKSMSGDLVVINNREEQRFLQSRVSENMDKAEDMFWIGLTDTKNEGEWLWVDNTQLNPRLRFWGGGQPDNWTGENPDGEDCVRMGEKKGDKDLVSWFDKSCESPQKSICEKPEKA
ncbi:CD209 antigen-like protein E [Limanda limanda]|uniref:CD209 antigen-like protein E n=1 Tax=Limanda limanda TaxID=27771 RepID=UPI0029C6ABDC|nr:CD209 antigen-like protein E [Limanda limanda]